MVPAAAPGATAWLDRAIVELHALSCLALEEIAPAKKHIVSSKSFGQMVATKTELGEAMTTYVSRAAEKLRSQRSVCGALQVFVMTNRFRENDAQYTNGMVVPLTERGHSVAEVGARLGVSSHSLYKWVKGVAPSKDEKQAAELIEAKGEILRLHAQMRRLEEERDRRHVEQDHAAGLDPPFHRI